MIRISVLALGLALLTPSDAFAYLDPGSGSLIFQTIAAVLAGTAYGVRMYWHKIRALFGRGSKGDLPDRDPKS